jgi:hypothetical protein
MKYYWKHKKEINLKDRLKYEESKDDDNKADT